MMLKRRLTFGVIKSRHASFVSGGGHGKVDGKKKVMGKERKKLKKKKSRGKKVKTSRLHAFFKRRQMYHVKGDVFIKHASNK
jgi:hypothetical protein